jgi:hypothetical protein
MKLGNDFCVVSVLNHPEEIRMKQRFSSVQEMDFVNELGSLIDNFFEDPEIHVPFFFFLQFFVRAHDAFQVAVAGRFNPEADGKVGEGGPFLFVAEKDLKELTVIVRLCHGILSTKNHILPFF